MKNSYIVEITNGTLFKSVHFPLFIKRVVSYKNNKVKTTLIQAMGFIYKNEISARKAANAFNGKVIII